MWEIANSDQLALGVNSRDSCNLNLEALVPLTDDAFYAL